MTRSRGRRLGGIASAPDAFHFQLPAGRTTHARTRISSRPMTLLNRPVKPRREHILQKGLRPVTDAEGKYDRRVGLKRASATLRVVSWSIAWALFSFTTCPPPISQRSRSACKHPSDFMSQCPSVYRQAFTVSLVSTLRQQIPSRPPTNRSMRNNFCDTHLVYMSLLEEPPCDFEHYQSLLFLTWVTDSGCFLFMQYNLRIVEPSSGYRLQSTAHVLSLTSYSTDKSSLHSEIVIDTWSGLFVRLFVEFDICQRQRLCTHDSESLVDPDSNPISFPPFTIVLLTDASSCHMRNIMQPYCKPLLRASTQNRTTSLRMGSTWNSFCKVRTTTELLRCKTDRARIELEGFHRLSRDQKCCCSCVECFHQNLKRIKVDPCRRPGARES
ncbi:uncharacterized protein BDR25DRAFT_358527 [Lindgomyces ingoldianus]|uniref:Uncharacterized protein n=1 Tax=Lindgomyces ingoldianus TaxID=673940 RepID=A0ACB6QK63_9PLEO|nr:uncharacterized protein BDR25DRAFT_358527 [Lindgomyces ingoldianus]KAF2467404.1 hypothetical protein BDR25DRAFT_358527 [Lindgomyces ingoldianus]